MTEEKYADKIAKLLRKAESTTPEEAELLLAKAQELMHQYAISEAMIDAARGVERDEIDQVTLVYTGIMRQALGQLGWAIVRANGCRGVYREWGSWTDSDGRVWRQCYFLTVTGFKSDLARVEMLNASLLVQAANAAGVWWKANKRTWLSKTEQHRERQGFLWGFAQAVEARLHAATKAGEQAAVKDEAERTSSTPESATESVALVLRSREDRVQDWYDEKYGKTLRTGRARYVPGGGEAHAAGRAAGARADVGQPGLRTRGALTA